MYLQFFGFNRDPFFFTPDPEVFFPGPSHKGALAVITDGVQRRRGLIELVGEVGLGKTLIVRSYLKQAEEDNNLRTVFLFYPDITFTQLLEAIYLQLGREFPATDEQAELLDHLHSALIEEYRCNRNIAVIIDDAQAMPVETLEQLCLLSNLESSGDKLLQILLVGQPELDGKLNSDELRELKQRISLRAELLPLTSFESAQYIKYRLSKVSRNGSSVLTERAMWRIVKHCEGIPRKINVVCGNAFVTAFGYRKKPVSRKIVNEVIADFNGTAKRTLRQLIPILTAAGLILLAAFAYERHKVAVESGRDKVRDSVTAPTGSTHFGILPPIGARPPERPESEPAGEKMDTPAKQPGAIESIDTESKGPPSNQESKKPDAVPGVVTTPQPEAPPESENRPVAVEQPSKAEQSPGDIPAQEVQPAPERPPTPPRSEAVSPKEQVGSDQADLEDLSEYIDSIIKKHRGR